MVNVTIDGIQLSVLMAYHPAGSKEVGIDIPTLCNHPDQQ
jgi:NADH dehydrogenase/NADH:ubiquinone oxidoreductase subunit G